MNTLYFRFIASSNFDLICRAQILQLFAGDGFPEMASSKRFSISSIPSSAFSKEVPTKTAS
jgi:hypothetical protein